MFEVKRNIIEYVWLDGYKPEPTLRSKIKVLDRDCVDVEEVPNWGFDGSSTQQAKGSSSDLILKPIRLYKSPFESERDSPCDEQQGQSVARVAGTGVFGSTSCQA